MGYSQYLVRLEKEKVNEIKGLSYDELLDKIKNEKGEYQLLFDDGIYLPDLFQILGGKELYDFGKDFDNDIINSVVKEPLFIKESTMDDFQDYSPKILKDDGVLQFINYYEERVRNYNKLLLTKPEIYGDYEQNPTKPDPLDIRDLDAIMQNDFIVKRIILDFISKKRSWDNGAILNKHKDKESLTYSSLYEYSVFDLLNIYKEIDNDKYCYIFYGR